MFKLCLLLIAVTASLAEARPGAIAYTGLPVASPVAYTGPGFVTATSSQFFARNYNGIAAPLVASAPYVAGPVAAPLSAAPFTSTYFF